ncbi:hypothetical protein [Aeromicrobium sp. UC242_57]|uniref:hypothetical protein n=1 Tax=Aeromicrobium sp. UC242_57 TaxID=3374624 RepID=UPI00378F2D25
MTALAAYLQTHLAGSRAGVDLFSRSAKGQLDHEIGVALDEIRREVADERTQLQQIMSSLDVDENLVRSTAARIGERIARLKPNGSLLHRTPLTDLVEVEALRIAVSGKQAGWESLVAIADLVPQLDLDQLEQLVAQGKLQLERLGELHAVVARRALTP